MLFVVLFEISAAVVIRVEALPVPLPTYSMDPPFWRDIDPDFGAWHVPGSQFRHKTSCFDVTYRANSVGARDRERTVEASGPRVIMLGDSFVEGFGSQTQARLSDLLEARSGVEHLNFAVANNAGTLQYSMIYRSLARKFAHTAVVVGILPDNDFLDNDYEFGRVVYAKRYRPYLVGDYPDYQVVHFDPARFYRDETSRDRLKITLRSFSNAYNLVVYVLSLRRYAASAPVRPAYSGYYDFNEADWQRMRYTLETLVADAAGRPVLVFTIPRLGDFERFGAEGAPPLVTRMQRLAADAGFAYVDLLPDMFASRPDREAFFQSCEGHWSDEGTRAAASVLQASPAYRAMLGGQVDDSVASQHPNASR